MKLYAIRVVETGKFLGVDYSANPSDAEFCCSVSFMFYTSTFADIPLWTTDSRSHAERIIANRDVAWYNADYSNPEFSSPVKNVELEVVEINI
jgi:hypothetical protein